jgi:serine protease inhibitor
MKKLLFVVLTVLSLLSACSPAAPGPSSPQGVKGISYRAELKSQPIQAVNGDLVAGINSFGFKSAGLLYNSEHNLAVSPVSLELALAMARAGAAGLTAEEMTKALGLSGMSNEDIVAACRSLMWRANTGGMEAANSIWLDQSYPFAKAFTDTCTGGFMADAFPLEIPGAMDAINAWAREKTHGKIDGIIQQELNPLTRLVLCNALYFLGDWTVPFDAKDTHDDDFASPAGAVTASFMNKERSVPYYSDDKLSMISLRFKSAEGEGNYAMAFLLPAEGSDLTSLLSSLSAETFSAALSGMSERQVDIKLPKFEYSFFSSFKDTLMALGMNGAFSDSADFSGMTGGDNDIYISDVLHKCYIKIDELGAEAAAVTAVIAEGSAMPPQDIPEFHADRPFAFAIYSQEDGAIAFLGAVNDPTQE